MDFNCKSNNQKGRERERVPKLVRAFVRIIVLDAKGPFLKSVRVCAPMKGQI